MAEYIEREALLHRTKAVAANVIFRGCEEMVSPKDSCNTREWTKGYEHGMKESLNLIATQGAADVVPVVHGRWEYHDCVCTGDGLISVYACSACQGCIDEEAFDQLYAQNYCPNCGAHMKDGE